MSGCAAKGVTDMSEPFVGSGYSVCGNCVGYSNTCMICRVSGACIPDDNSVCPITGDRPTNFQGVYINGKEPTTACGSSNWVDNYMHSIYMLEVIFSSATCANQTSRAAIQEKFEPNSPTKDVPNPFKPFPKTSIIESENDPFQLNVVAPEDATAIDICMAPSWIGTTFDVSLMPAGLGLVNASHLANPASLFTCSFPGMHSYRISLSSPSQAAALSGNTVVDLTRVRIEVASQRGNYKSGPHYIDLAQGGPQHPVGRICPPLSPSPDGGSSNNIGPDGSGGTTGGTPSSGTTTGDNDAGGNSSGGGMDAAVIGAIAGGLVAVILVVVACVMLELWKRGRRMSGRGAAHHASAAGGRFSLGRMTAGGNKVKNLKKFNGYTGGAVTVKLDNQGDDSLRPGVSKEQWTKQLVASLGSVSQDIVIDFATVAMGKKIASGGGGQVFVAQWNNAEVVVKEPFWFAGTSSQDLINEIQMLAELEHPNVVQFFGVSHANRSVYIVTEYCPLGSLNDWLEQKRFPWNSFYPCACQLMHTLQWLHESGVVHRDIKPHNILMASETSLKICDLGTCRNQVHGNQSMTANVGTLSYTPPEVMSARRAVYDGRKWDVYSASLVLFYMYTGKRPFGDRSNFQIITGVANKNGLRPEYVDCGIPGNLWQLMESMWAEDPDDRPLAGDAGTKLAAISNQDASTLGVAGFGSQQGGGADMVVRTAEEYHEEINVAPGPVAAVGGGAWTTVYDEVHGQHYYYNESTGESRWTAPDLHGTSDSLGAEMKTQNNPMLR